MTRGRSLVVETYLRGWRGMSSKANIILTITQSLSSGNFYLLFDDVYIGSKLSYTGLCLQARAHLVKIKFLSGFNGESGITQTLIPSE